MFIRSIKQPLLAISTFLVLVCVAAEARAQQVQVNTSPSFGTVVAATSGQTVFQVSTSGTVTRVSGNGVRVTTSPGVPATIGLTCNTSWCKSDPIEVKIANSGSPTNRAGPLSGFTATLGTAQLYSGSPGVAANPLTFTIKPIGSSTATFTFGFKFPVYGDDSEKTSGDSASGFTVTMIDSKKSSNSASGSGVASARIYHSMSISQTSALNFGRVVRPASGVGSIIMPASTGARTVVGGVGLANPTPARGAFTVTGEGGQTISVSVPSSITVQNSANGSITITTSTTASGAQALSGSMGQSGSFTFYVGGALNLSSSMSTGGYTGTYTVSVSYN